MKNELDNKFDEQLSSLMKDLDKEAPADSFDIISKRIHTRFLEKLIANFYFKIGILAVIIAGIGLGLKLFIIPPSVDDARISNSSTSIPSIQLPKEILKINEPFSQKNTLPVKKQQELSSSITSAEQVQTINSSGNGQELFDLNVQPITMSMENNQFFVQGITDTNGFRIIQPPMHGKMVFDPISKRYKYQPNKGFIGNDFFKYAIIDPQGNIINEGTLKIKVTGNELSHANFDYRIETINKLVLINTSKIIPKDSLNFQFTWILPNGDKPQSKDYVYQLESNEEQEVCLYLKTPSGTDTFCKKIDVSFVQKVSETPSDSFVSTVEITSNEEIILTPKNNQAGLISAERAQQKKDITDEELLNSKDVLKQVEVSKKKS